MKPVSSRFLAALRGSHTSQYRVRVLTTFQTGTDPSGTEVDIVTGSVTLDGTANERGSLDLTLDSQAGQQWPTNQFGALTPFGNELFVERGIAGLATPPPPVEGGSITDRDGYRYHTFTSDGSLIVNREVSVEYLIVAGGGGGGGGQVSGYGGSGGGAGGVVTGSTVLSPGSYSVTVGDGGGPLTNGDNSEIDGVDTAIGGGAGGGGAGNPAPGSGGSGGGAIPVGAANPGSGTVGQGNDGGSIGVGGTEAGAGGGGAGAPGGDTGPGARDPGDGGDGIEWPAGSGNFYGGGGGGSNGSGGGGGVVSSGGLGGGGFGHSGSGDGGDGAPNTGGGGGATRSGTPGSGGSGIVIVRYPLSVLDMDVDDATEWVPLGYFRIETIEQDDAPRSPIRITARDRMAAIIEARMLEPRTFAAGTTFREVFENLVLEVYPDAVLDIDDAVASSTLREPATVEEDRFEFLQDMATSRGRVMFFDHRGVFVVAPEPDSTAPVFTVNEGADGVLINVRRQLSRAGVYNAVVAEGTEADYDNEEPPARAVVFDDNPNSATYFFGPFGQVPRFYSSPFIFTEDQAQSAAASILSRTTGIPYTLDITAIPNPALEPLDPIRVIFEAGREEIHVIDVITIPLTSDQPMVISSRSLVQFIAGGDEEGTLLSGGTETVIEDNGTFYRVHTFTSSGTLTVIRPGLVEYLVVAAGGGSSQTNVEAGGGGGGGGVRQGSGLLIDSDQTITVGAGVPGANGQNSSIGSLIVAIGGGRGGQSNPNEAGASGGSGGGGAGGGATATYAGGSGTGGQGNSGGTGQGSSLGPRYGGGGGGAGASGGSAVGGSGGSAGNGGIGVQSSITGTATFYGGGGGGCARNSAPSGANGSGGLGGGGTGALNNTPGTAGAANTGGGAGGQTNSGGNLPGGSGIVVIRYPIQ